MDARRVWDCILCACVSEEGGDGKGVVSETPSLLSYILRYSVGLILAKVSVIRISIPLDLSVRPFIPLPRFIRSRRPIPLLAPSLVLFPQCSD